jgi:hypothetical protein
MKQLCMAAVLLSLAARATAQVHVVNGDFATDLSGWTFEDTNGTAEWTPLDAQDAPDSGSAQITLTPVCTPLPGGGYTCSGGRGMRQCVAVRGGSQYRIGMSVFVPSGQSTEGVAFLFYEWSGGETCDDVPLLWGSLGVTSQVKDAWQEVARRVYAPPGARHLRVTLVPSRNEEYLEGSFTADFDDVFVIRKPRRKR